MEDWLSRQPRLAFSGARGTGFGAALWRACWIIWPKHGTAGQLMDNSRSQMANREIGALATLWRRLATGRPTIQLREVWDRIARGRRMVTRTRRGDMKGGEKPDCVWVDRVYSVRIPRGISAGGRNHGRISRIFVAGKASFPRHAVPNPAFAPLTVPTRGK